MELVFSDSAKKELENLPQELKVLFLNRLETNEARDPLPCSKGDQTGEDRLRDQRREDLCASLLREP
jgi:mRNA-degrading endonuclease RelE of RelBE toxin-antitoxin system